MSPIATGGPQERAAYRLNPLTTLALAVFLVVLTYAVAAPWGAGAALAGALLLAGLTGYGGRIALLALAVGAPAFALLFLMNGIVATEGAELVRVGPVDIAPSAAIGALRVALRLAAAVAALGWVVSLVPPRHLAQALGARGLPAWAAYLLVASLDAVPQARRRAVEVIDAQRARGLRIGSGLARVRTLLPSAGPLIVSLVSEAEERALALDARGFDPRARRSALVPLADPAGERAVRMAIWLVAALLILLRLFGMRGG
jgi:energy-coupling factor transport system permease protein